MSWPESVLGANLLVKPEEDAAAAGVLKPTRSVLFGKKYVGLYFSAQWCGASRKYTPFLSACYEELDDKAEIEIVFVSNDKELDFFNEYYAEMPWAAIPFEFDRFDTFEKYGTPGLPTLLILDASTGAIVDAEGRAKVVAARKLGGVFGPK